MDLSLSFSQLCKLLDVVRYSAYHKRLDYETANSISYALLDVLRMFLDSDSHSLDLSDQIENLNDESDEFI